MFFTKSFLVAQKEEEVDGTVVCIFKNDPLKVTFLGFHFELGKTRYFADVKYRCPVNNATRYVRLLLSRDKFILLDENKNITITIKLMVCREYVYGIASPLFSIPVGIE